MEDDDAEDSLATIASLDVETGKIASTNANLDSVNYGLEFDYGPDTTKKAWNAADFVQKEVGIVSPVPSTTTFSAPHSLPVELVSSFN